MAAVRQSQTFSARAVTTLFVLFAPFFSLAGPEDPGEGGAWSAVQGWPMIPVSAANLPDGRIVAWASNERTSFPGGRPEFTYTAVWDPESNSFTEIPHPSHDMFCSHHVMMEDGKVSSAAAATRATAPGPAPSTRKRTSGKCCRT